MGWGEGGELETHERGGREGATYAHTLSQTRTRERAQARTQQDKLKARHIPVELTDKTAVLPNHLDRALPSTKHTQVHVCKGSRA